jgi:hypothetical protein
MGRQKEIVFRIHGGARRGAGRKPKGERPLVSHDARAALTGREPVLVDSEAYRARAETTRAFAMWGVGASSA